MKLIRLITLAMLPALICYTGLGQTYWSLEDCIQYAVDNNIQYKRQKLVAQSSGVDHLNAGLQMLPSLYAGANASQNWGTTFSYDKLEYVDLKNLDGSFGVQAQMDLFSGFSRLNNKSRYKYNLLSNLENVESIKNSITLEIVSAYLQILLNKELLKLAEEQLEVTKQQVLRTQKLVEVGNEPKGRLLEIQSQEALEKSNVTAARNDLKLSYLTMIQLLFLDSIGDFEVVIPEDLQVDEASVINSPNAIYNLSKNIMPEIKSAEYFLKSEEKRLAGLRGQRYPNLSMRFSYYTRFSELADHPDPALDEYPYIDQIKDFQYRQVTLSLYFPLFNQWTTQSQIDKSKINVFDAKLALDQSKQDLYRNIQQAHARATAALDNYMSNMEAVESQQEAFEYAEQRFEVGLISSVDYNIAKNNLTKAQSDLLQSKFQYIFSTKILDFYNGNPITL